MDNNNCGKLAPCAFGFAMGVTIAVYILILGLIAMQWGYGSDMVKAISEIYIGYKATFIGSLVGGLWGLVDGFIFGFILAWLYNRCLCCSKGSCK